MSTFAPSETINEKEGTADLSKRGGGPGNSGEGAHEGVDADIGTHHRARETPGVMREVLCSLEELLRPL